jgi:hypothetical protein
MLAAVAAFLAHEPLLVVLGRRGTRARRQDGKRAERLLALATTFFALAGGFALVLGGERWTTLLPTVALTLLSGVFLFYNREKTLAGEIVAAATLSSLALPVGAFSGVAESTAAIVALVWTLGFSLATFSVRQVIAVGRDHRRRDRLLAVVPSVGVATLAFATIRLVPGAVLGWSLAPFVVMSAGLSLVPPAPRHLKRVGWSLIATSVLTLVLMAMLGPTALRS